MMVKRYVVQDMPEAIVLIRRELGKNAVILSTRKITVKKWLGFVRKKQIEVLAAAGEDVPIRTAGSSKAQSVAAEKAGVPGSRLVEDEPSSQVAAASGSSDLQQLRDELTQVKVSIQQLLNDKAETREKEAVPSAALCTRLRSQGLQNDRLVNAMAEMMCQLQEDKDLSPEALPKTWIEHFTELFPGYEQTAPLGESARVIAFIGQTGVGKTTTVAKVAALEMLSGQKKVGLITTDTYRIAAVEQLRTYARILDVPLEIVERAEEVETAIARLRDRDLILIDTAGRNYGLQENFAEMTRFLQLPAIDETHLVLSLTSKPEDLNRIAERFSAFPVDKFLFTKLDETSTHAAALELLHRFNKPVSYITNGQNVPDDIEIGSLERLVTLILEGAA